MVDGAFTWFDLLTPDVSDAQAFYADVLHWNAAELELGERRYCVLRARDAAQARLVSVAPGTSSAWRSHLAVDDIDARLGLVEMHGGAATSVPIAIPGVGRYAVVTDPQGAALSLLAREPAAPISTEFHWNELWAPHAEQVLPFYREALGYGVHTMQMASGPYHVLRNGCGGQGGVMDAPANGPRGRWLPYVRVDDCDATVERARKHGGAVELGPTLIANIGRIAIVVDRGGAPLGLITPTG